jgi:Helix-turn-helix domain
MEVSPGHTSTEGQTIVDSLTIPQSRLNLLVEGVHMIIGDRLRTICQKKRLTHADIERRCGISKTQISRIENGHSVTSVVELEEGVR